MTAVVPSASDAIEKDASASRYDRLIQPARVHGSLYTDPTIFAEELRKIWHKTWVFVGHESEVPQPNDYVRKQLGRPGRRDDPRQGRRDPPAHQPVRAPRPPGLRRPVGQLQLVPLPLPRLDLPQLRRAARLPLQQGLRRQEQARARNGEGRPRRVVPRLRVRQSRRGRSVPRRAPRRREGRDRPAGAVSRPRAGCRWTPAGCGTGLDRTGSSSPRTRPTATTRSSSTARSSASTGSPIGALYSDNSTAVTRNLGDGHSENDLRPEFRKLRRADALVRHHARQGAGLPGRDARTRTATTRERRTIEGAPHVMIFPNLFIAEIQVFNIQPVAVGECVQYSTAVQFDGGHELNMRMVSQSIGSVGPAGMLLADDTEMYERNQRGVRDRGSGMARRPARSRPRVGRRERLHDRRGDRRNRDARFLGSLQVPDGGERMTSELTELPPRPDTAGSRSRSRMGGRSGRSSSSSTGRPGSPTRTSTTPGRRCGPTTRSTGSRSTARASIPGRPCRSSSTTATGSPRG